MINLYLTRSPFSQIQNKHHYPNLQNRKRSFQVIADEAWFDLMEMEMFGKRIRRSEGVRTTVDGHEFKKQASGKQTLLDYRKDYVETHEPKCGEEKFFA